VKPDTQAPATLRASGNLDLVAALERVEGDRGLLEELLRLFAKECPNNVAEIRRAFEHEDAPLLERLAHTMKGSAASLGAKSVSEAARALEEQARSKSLDGAEAWIERLNAKLKELLGEIETLLPKAAE
jgi:two-component system, sensor histidine kinase and response regulator